LFGALSFMKWQNYSEGNNEADLVGFGIFSIAFVVNIFDVRYSSKKKVGSSNNA
jgi:hypothetical protein